MIFDVIRIDERLPRRDKEGTYGHEQLHIRNMIELTNERIVANLAGHERTEFPGRILCTREGERLKEHYQNNWDILWGREVAHRNYPDPTTYGSYPPDGEMPLDEDVRRALGR